MNKLTLSIFFLLFNLFSQTNAQSSDRITIKDENLSEANYLKVDDFYLTHYLYIDLFLRENLLLDASIEEVSSVINAIKKYVSKDNPLVIEIKKEEGLNYVIVIMLQKKENKEILISYTNWNPKLKIFENGVTDDSYTRWYFLNQDKMTYRNDLSSEKDYSIMDSIDLSNAYLFDELENNDSEIEDIIQKTIKNKDLSTEDYITSQLILLKFYILNRNKDKINEIIEDIKKLFINNKENTNLKGLEAAFNTTLFQIELMK